MKDFGPGAVVGGIQAKILQDVHLSQAAGIQTSGWLHLA